MREFLWGVGETVVVVSGVVLFGILWAEYLKLGWPCE